MSNRLHDLKEKLVRVADLDAAASLLDWDRETYMPPGAAETRAKQAATVRRLAHDLLTSNEIGSLLQELEVWLGLPDADLLDAAFVKAVKREYERAVKLPGKLVADLAEAVGLAINAWVKARNSADFSVFLPHLEKLIELNMLKAEALGYSTSPYDALLDEFESGMTTSVVEDLFSQIRVPLTGLVREIVEKGCPVADDFLHEEYPPELQKSFGMQVLGQIGFDFGEGRLDEAEHPFTMRVALDDVRITSRYSEKNLAEGLFAIIHEGGHGMYYQGIDKRFMRTPLAEGASSALHESQARLWENVVGGSREFWNHFFPRLREVFPKRLAGVTVEDFYRAVNKVTPSHIRVDADEVTYNLHIFIRFELEKGLFSGEIRPAELPERWNALSEAYLGIVPPDDSLGVLQDIHWSSGLFGYFPTYALGNIYSLQLYSKAVEEYPDIPQRMSEGDFSLLHTWLKENVWWCGSLYEPIELLKKVTGEGPNAAPYLEYIQKKYRELYQLTS